MEHSQIRPGGIYHVNRDGQEYVVRVSHPSTVGSAAWVCQDTTSGMWIVIEPAEFIREAPDDG